MKQGKQDTSRGHLIHFSITVKDPGGCVPVKNSPNYSTMGSRDSLPLTASTALPEAVEAH